MPLHAAIIAYGAPTLLIKIVKIVIQHKSWYNMVSRPFQKEGSVMKMNLLPWRWRMNMRSQPGRWPYLRGFVAGILVTLVLQVTFAAIYLVGNYRERIAVHDAGAFAHDDHARRVAQYIRPDRSPTVRCETRRFRQGMRSIRRTSWAAW